MRGAGCVLIDVIIFSLRDTLDSRVRMQTERYAYAKNGGSAECRCSYMYNISHQCNRTFM